MHKITNSERNRVVSILDDSIERIMLLSYVPERAHEALAPAVRELAHPAVALPLEDRDDLRALGRGDRGYVLEIPKDARPRHRELRRVKLEGLALRPIRLEGNHVGVRLLPAVRVQIAAGEHARER